MLEIYAVEIKNRVSKELFEKALFYIPEEKKKKIRRFIKFEDSLRSLIAEALIRKVIVTELGIKNNEISFGVGKYGKPYLNGQSDFHFNISHSGEWVVCAISTGTVGIDVEAIKNLDMGIANRFFSKEETDDLFLMNDNERLKYFFELWTLKESYIKAEGSGLNIPLNSFSFRIIDGNILFSTKNDFQNCFFKRYDFDKNYKLSVCSVIPNFPENVQIITVENLLYQYLDIVEA